MTECPECGSEDIFPLEVIDHDNGIHLLLCDACGCEFEEEV